MALLYVTFTPDLSEVLDKCIFYDCLLSAILKVIVLRIYKFGISYTRLVSPLKGRFIK